jgi:hypothetical protein
MKPEDYQPFLRAQLLAEQKFTVGETGMKWTTREAHEVHYEYEPTFWQRLLAFLKEAW